MVKWKRGEHWRMRNDVLRNEAGGDVYEEHVEPCWRSPGAR